MPTLPTGKSTTSSKKTAGAEEASKPPLTDASKLRELLALKFKGLPKAKRKAAIFTHARPDPDAIGSQMAISHLLLTAHDIESTCFVDGDISHPQNKVAVQLLDPHLVPVKQYKPDDFALKVLVDSIPKHAGTGGHDVNFDVVVDHHKELPNGDFEGLFIHHHSGSCAGIIYGMLVDENIVWDDADEEHVKVATAILVGIITDTNFCTKPDTTARDFLAQQGVFGIADQTFVRSIVKFEWPMSWVKLLGVAINEHETFDGIAVVGLGILKPEQHDAVAAIADAMLSWGNVKTAVAFAYFQPDYVSGCLRTKDQTIEVHALCAALGGKHGQGGGKSMAGRYEKPLGAFEFTTDEGQDVMLRWWDIQKEREISKILQVLKQ